MLALNSQVALHYSYIVLHSQILLLLNYYLLSKKGGPTAYLKNFGVHGLRKALEPEANRVRVEISRDEPYSQLRLSRPV